MNHSFRALMNAGRNPMAESEGSGVFGVASVDRRSSFGIELIGTRFHLIPIDSN